MKLSFVTKFRRHIAKVPFFLVVALPGLMVALYFVSRSHSAPDIDVTGDSVCVEADVVTGRIVDACPDGSTFAGE